MVNQDLINNVLGEFRLKPTSQYGPSHWARVLVNGRILAAETGADLQVVELFAILHDSKRRNESDDPDHGKRAAAFAETLRGLLFDLSDDAFNLLYDACAFHNEGGTSGHITLQTCWDADRLDLGRRRKTPMIESLCTESARDPDILNPAHERASNLEVPAFVSEEWGLNLSLKKKTSWF